LHACAFSQFGEAFESIPRVLADNSGQDATVVVAKLYAAHAKSAEASPPPPPGAATSPSGPNVGVDIEATNGGVKDVLADGIFDLMVTKESAIRLAVDAALTVLRVDQIIMSKPAGTKK